MNPSVQGRDGNAPVLAEIRDSSGASQVSVKDGQDKAQGIGTKWNEDIWKDSMCVSAGSTFDLRNRDHCFNPLTMGNGDQETVVGLGFLEAVNRTAGRAGAFRRDKIRKSLFKKLFVRKMYLI